MPCIPSFPSFKPEAISVDVPSYSQHFPARIGAHVPCVSPSPACRTGRTQPLGGDLLAWSNIDSCLLSCSMSCTTAGVQLIEIGSCGQMLGRSEASVSSLLSLRPLRTTRICTPRSPSGLMTHARFCVTYHCCWYLTHLMHRCSPQWCKRWHVAKTRCDRLLIGVMSRILDLIRCWVRAARPPLCCPQG